MRLSVCVCLLSINSAPIHARKAAFSGSKKIKIEIQVSWFCHAYMDIKNYKENSSSFNSSRRTVRITKVMCIKYIGWRCGCSICIERLQGYSVTSRRLATQQTDGHLHRPLLVSQTQLACLYDSLLPVAATAASVYIEKLTSHCGRIQQDYQLYTRLHLTQLQAMYVQSADDWCPRTKDNPPCTSRVMPPLWQYNRFLPSCGTGNCFFRLKSGLQRQQNFKKTRVCLGIVF